MKKLLLITLFTFLPCSCAPFFFAEAKTPDKTQYIRAVLGEAESEEQIGMFAVACGIRNRPEGLKGVYGVGSDRYDQTLTKYRNQAQFAWEKSKDPGVCWDLIQGSDMWCSNIEHCSKAWTNVSLIYITKIGNHNFYRRLITKKE